MHDWVWVAHAVIIRSSFTYVDKGGAAIAPYNAETFANALEQLNPDFGRIRGIANAAKHLTLRNVRPVANAPAHATETAIQIARGAWGRAWGNRWGTTWGGKPRVMLTGASGEMEFTIIAKSVFDMWSTLCARHCW
jgi:hypothetical protein